ncbi:MAG TPA: tetraacyldisaccharide 4'-kinase [Acetobacteraceae bacterium]|nr:tetraacyldisaccharide 4'-kinase [Acetobacteraceae bacterium]
MLRPPRFWSSGSTVLPTLLCPLAALSARLTAARIARPGFAVPVPVICCGNATLGGAGKTTLALDLAHRLRAAGIAVHILARGYGGRARGPLLVRPEHDAALIGDEALLLAQVAPTWIGADRAATARSAFAAGATALVMDDGLQNPTLKKTLSFIVIDGGGGFGNGRVFPAGPLREPIAAAAARAAAAILIGPDHHGTRALLPSALPVLAARLVPGLEAAALAGRRVLAFAGIGRPEKFFATLEEAGAVLVARHAFPDHHSYREAELSRLLVGAARLNAMPVTTAKDHVRLPLPLRGRIALLTVTLAWDDPTALNALLSPLFPGVALP